MRALIVGLVALACAGQAAAQEAPFSQTIQVDARYRNVCDVTSIRSHSYGAVRSVTSTTFEAQRSGDQLVFMHETKDSARFIAWTASPQRILAIRQSDETLASLAPPTADDESMAAGSGGMVFSAYDWLLDGRTITTDAQLFEPAVLAAIMDEAESQAAAMGEGVALRFDAEFPFQGLHVNDQGRPVLVFEGAMRLQLDADVEGEQVSMSGTFTIRAAYDPTTGLLVSARDHATTQGTGSGDMAAKTEMLRVITCRAELR